MDFRYECIMHHWGCLLEAYFIFWWLYCLQETDTKAGYMCENLCVKNPVIKQMRGGNKDSQTESLLINQTKLTAELSNSFFSFSSRRERHCWNIRAENREFTEDMLNSCLTKSLLVQHTNVLCPWLYLPLRRPLKWTLSCLHICNKHA